MKGQTKAFSKWRIPGSNCKKKKINDIDILATSRNGDRKIMQTIRIMGRPLSKTKKWNQFSQFRGTSGKVNLLR